MYRFSFFETIGIKNKILSTSKQYSVTGKNVKILYSNDMMPKTTKKKIIPLIIPNKIKSIKTTKIRKQSEKQNENNELRVNEINMQMLSKNIYQQIFKMTTDKPVSHKLVEECLSNLKTHGMKTDEVTYMPDVELKLPPLEGNNIIEHYKIIGEQQAKSYRDLLNGLLKEIPQKPRKWQLQPGWTRYAANKEPQIVTHPLEDALVFDVEICIKAGKIPTLATAVSNKAWYGWVSQALVDEDNRSLATHYSLDDLIPLENISKGYNLSTEFLKHRVVVGHNVSFDRGRVKEQYFFEQTGTRFVDTMSFHICVSGITSYQRALLKSNKEFHENDDKWKLISSLNSLSEVHKLYCGSEINKATRDIFMEGTLPDIKNDFNNVMNYCAGDVLATYNVFKILFPLFLERFPHPVTFAGMLELGMAYLPINANWNRYINECEQTYEDLNVESKFLLARRADQACQLMHDEIFQEDLWMWDQDWTIQDFKLKKVVKKQKETKIFEDSKSDETKTNFIEDKTMDYLEEYEPDLLQIKFQSLFDTTYLPARKPHLPGYPAWYRKLCSKPVTNDEWIPGPHLISTSMQVTPKILNLTWEGYPLHYIRKKGWGLLVPHSNDIKNKQIPMKKLVKKCPILNINPSESNYYDEALAKDLNKNLNQKAWWRCKKRKDETNGTYKGTGIWCNINLEDCCWFMKLPHKDGVSNNVGNPLARDFLNKFANNVLAGNNENTEKLLFIARMMSYWRNNRDRIMQQVLIWLKQSEIPKNIRSENYQFGVILPQVVVCGTLTRRAMEPTWMTASNAQKDRVGSELRSMVQAPPGYSIVGADVDSQELWIASILGDAHHCGLHGGTPLGWMTLIGTKSHGTDMHSITANVVGISRDHAKIINYARIYGAGQNFAERLLKQFNPSMSGGEAKSKASKMFSITKGKRMFKLKPGFTDNFLDKSYSAYQAYETARACGKTIDDLFFKSSWIGGSESAMFNRLEEIAGNLKPVTPFLEGRLSRALEPQDSNMNDDKFLPTRVNWVVQSGAVDFLHLMLVTMRWLMKDKVRFCLSFHDEIRYLVEDKYKYDAALAMHITNLLTRSFCSVKLGINDLPMSVAFFSSVEVDTVLRKEAHLDCKTPSNPHGLEKGYKIKNGDSLDIHQCLEKTGGEISLWNTKKN